MPGANVGSGAKIVRSDKLSCPLIGGSWARDMESHLMAESSTVSYDVDGSVVVITIERPTARNAVNRPTAQALAAAFRRFGDDASSSVAILTGRGGAFCAGADLKQIAAGRRDHRVESGDAPMGPTRLKLDRPRHLRGGSAAYRSRQSRRGARTAESAGAKIPH